MLTTERHQLPSSLARLIVGMIDPSWEPRQDAHFKLSVALRALVDSDNWSDRLKCSNEIAALSRAEIARANRTTTSARAIEKWKLKTGGVDPVKFYALTLYYAYRLGGHRSMAGARRHALLLQRPDLFLRSGIWKSPADAPANIRPMLNPVLGAKRMRERRALELQLKGLIEKPPAALKPILAQVRTDFDKAVAGMSAADYAFVLTEAKRLGLVPYTFAGNAKTIFVGRDELKQIEADEREWEPSSPDCDQAISIHLEREPTGPGRNIAENGNSVFSAKPST